MSKTYAKDPKKVADSARLTQAIKALNEFQKEYKDVLTISEYWTIEDVARYPLGFDPCGAKAEDKMSRKRIVNALQLLRNTEPNFAALQDAVMKSLFN